MHARGRLEIALGRSLSLARSLSLPACSRTLASCLADHSDHTCLTCSAPHTRLALTVRLSLLPRLGGYKLNNGWEPRTPRWANSLGFGKPSGPYGSGSHPVAHQTYSDGTKITQHGVVQAAGGRGLRAERRRDLCASRDHGHHEDPRLLA